MSLLEQAKMYKEVYSTMSNYKELREGDKDFFDTLFIILLFDNKKYYTNAYLSKRLNIPESTLEKRLKRLDHAKLIQRKVNSELVGGVWRTASRSIQLDSVTFAFMNLATQEERIRAARLQALENGKYIEPIEAHEEEEFHKIEVKY